MKKFRIFVTGKNKEEFEKRIEDNIKRGFKLIKTNEFDNVIEKNKRISGGYNEINEYKNSKLIAYMEK